MPRDPVDASPEADPQTKALGLQARLYHLILRPEHNLPLHDLKRRSDFMKEAAPTLLPLLRSRSQGDLLAVLFMYPDEPVTLTALAQRLGVSVATVSREVHRLAEAGLLLEKRAGSARLVRARTDHRLFQPLADLLALTFGPRAVLTDLLTDAPGVEEAFIYGSWAARYTGHPGHVPNDIDVLVIGTPDREHLDVLADEAERLLHRPVDIRTVRAVTWADSDRRTFLGAIRSRPRVRLV